MSYLCLYNIFPMNNPLLYDHLYQNICIRVNDYFRLDVSPKFGQFDTIYFVANHDNSHLYGSNQCDLTWFQSVFNKIIKVILVTRLLSRHHINQLERGLGIKMKTILSFHQYTDTVLHFLWNDSLRGDNQIDCGLNVQIWLFSKLIISHDLDQTIVNRFLVISCKNTSTVD